VDKTMVLKRIKLTDTSTIGKLYLPDGSRICFTLEDQVRRNKIAGKTAIPAGKYEIAVTWSNRFKKQMPLLMSVPFFSGVRIHKGNMAESTEGCLLVGRKKGKDSIWESGLAFKNLFPKIQKMCGEGKLFIDIQGGYPADKWDMGKLE
jgi:hypothetical protein